MSDLQLILYDDTLARNWFPFTLTRPAGELLCGAHTQRSRAEQIFKTRCIGHITAEELAGFDEPDAPGVLTLERIDTNADRVFWSARAVPAWSASLERSSGPAVMRIRGEAIGYYCPAGSPNPVSLDRFSGHAIDFDGHVLHHVWELMSHNAEQVATDAMQVMADRGSPVPEGVSAIGRPRLALGRNVRFEPGVVLDFSEGPIWLDDDVVVRSFTRLAGPAYVGKQSTLLGGPYTGVSIGPVCKVHGEMEATVVLGYSNKAHDGFLGHAYLGRWVNLGAMTTNSDLKNNYGPVRLWTPDGEVDTGEMKIGCFLGDHVKTGIGSLLNTGTVVGPGSNLFGTDQPPRYVPAFSWGSGEELVEYKFDKFIATAQTAMSRRKVQLSEKQRELLRVAWERGRALTGKSA